MIGSCTLVGAGPGDPELLTLKAVKAIQSATLLLVDDLVSDAIVALAPQHARIVRVGKRGGCRSTPQAFIEKMMISAVRQGECVVRLKGGDPFIFGRGGEEVERLRAAGIAAKVVNGITAGLAGMTALGVPLTHRQHAQGVLFVTGHAQADGSATNWPLLATTACATHLTLVIYMGMARCSDIAQGLLAGLPFDTPAVVIQNASLPEQRHACTLLGQLQDTVTRESLGSPSVIVVGDVLRGMAALQQTPPARIFHEQKDYPKFQIRAIG